MAQDALPPPANAGTLTCTLTPVNEAPQQSLPKDETALSCSFEAITGPGGSFAGIIKRLSTDEKKETKVVLMWTVLAPKPDVQLKDLEGKYMGSLEQSPPVGGATPGLRGGHNDTIELRPLNATPEPKGPSSSSISVLQLALQSTKA